jgi:hypothetical protein
VEPVRWHKRNRLDVQPVGYYDVDADYPVNRTINKSNMMATLNIFAISIFAMVAYAFVLTNHASNINAMHVPVAIPA